MAEMVEYICSCGVKFLHRAPDGTWGGKPACDVCWEKARQEGRIGVGSKIIMGPQRDDL